MDDIIRLTVTICFVGWIPILALGKAISMIVYAIRCNINDDCEEEEEW